MPAAYALLGPTASGKSRLALQLAGRLPVEIIGVDSAQVYRGMDIGTAKPSRAERARVPHHLIDIVDPTEAYSAGRFRTDCIRIVEDVLRRGRIPLLVGGTMLYYRALAGGLDALPAADPAIRAGIEARARRLGWPALHAELSGIDPDTAARLKPNDAQRIQRALEVWESTGRKMSDLQGKAKNVLPFRLIAFSLMPQDRGALHRRIAERFDRMLADGLVAEVESLKERYRLRAELPSMRCVGYRQIWSYLAGEYDDDTMRERAIAATRQLAKRQLTWLRSLKEVEPVVSDAARLASRLAA